MGEHAASVHAAALAALPDMTLSRLSALLRHHDPRSAWAVVCGMAPCVGVTAHLLAANDGRLAARWRQAATVTALDEMSERLTTASVSVLMFGEGSYPQRLMALADPPPILFTRGHQAALGTATAADDSPSRRTVAIVGTRNCTEAGRSTAARFGNDLTAAGVSVVSGLARGIDGAAHSGALVARARQQSMAATTVGAAAACGAPIAVVGSGPDVVYPREHAALWDSIIEHGVVLSESPPGAAPLPYRFPMRNRLVVALADVLVVVESRQRGGSLITVDLALEAGVPVMAVPGALGNPAAAGTNRLLRDGAVPVLETGDILAELGVPAQVPRSLDSERRPRPHSADIAFYDALREQPRTVEGVSLVSGASLVAAAMALARLQQAGWIAQTDGWFEVVGTPPGCGAPWA
jgi:DNA processing protein